MRILKEADLIACEDTRQTRKLLDRCGIERPTISYHEHNEAARTQELLARLREGATIALVSDAGMPLVSDPGYRLVNAAIEAGIVVQAIPGPCAFVTALAASGLPTDAFHFAGFLPAKSGQRRKVLEGLKNEQATLVFYEAPHRVLEALQEIEAILGQRQVVVARELTKVHEEFLRGTAGELRFELEKRDAIKGEITLLVGRAERDQAHDTPIEEAVSACMLNGLTRMDAMKAVARERGLPKREVYRQAQAHFHPETHRRRD